MTVSVIFGVLGLSGITFWGLYNRARENLILDIRNLIEDCRGLPSWDDVRSELKLSSWLEGEEKQLHWRPLKSLHRARESMARCYWVHMEMQEGAEYGDFQPSPQPFSQFVVREMLGLRRYRWR